MNVTQAMAMRVAQSDPIHISELISYVLGNYFGDSTQIEHDIVARPRLQSPCHPALPRVPNDNEVI